MGARSEGAFWDQLYPSGEHIQGRWRKYLVLKMQSYYHFEKVAPAPVKAHFVLPSGSGYGIEFDPATVEKQEVVHWS